MNSHRALQSAVLLGLVTGLALAGSGAPTEIGAAPTSRAQDLESEGYERLLQQRRDGTFTKAGWNHYGPGYFELDEQNGILTSHGGMGLFWYSVREFGDFRLELDFMTDLERANSGVFLRVPGLLSSNDYISHSFERFLTQMCARFSPSRSAAPWEEGADALVPANQR